MKINIHLRYVIVALTLSILLPVNVFASRFSDAEAVVTLRDGQPCFSYPQDEVIRMRPYLFGYIAVAKQSQISSKAGWEAQMADPYGKGLLAPNTPKNCIKYGGPHPGVEDRYGPATQLQMDTPYYVFIGVISRSEGGLYERKFLSNFCLTIDEKGNKVIVGAVIDDNAKYNLWKCLKPGEKPKKRLWERLFGN